MFSIAGVYSHYFYMLFTFNSKQLGLYSEEVKNQIKNAQKKKCKYCAKPGAIAR